MRVNVIHLIEDSDIQRRMAVYQLNKMLVSRGFTVVPHPTGEEFLAYIARENNVLRKTIAVISDYNLDGTQPPNIPKGKFTGAQVTAAVRGLEKSLIPPLSEPLIIIGMSAVEPSSPGRSGDHVLPDFLAQGADYAFNKQELTNGRLSWNSILTDNGVFARAERCNALFEQQERKLLAEEYPIKMLMGQTREPAEMSNQRQLGNRYTEVQDENTVNETFRINSSEMLPRNSNILQSPRTERYSVYKARPFNTLTQEDTPGYTEEEKIEPLTAKKKVGKCVCPESFVSAVNYVGSGLSLLFSGNIFRTTAARVGADKAG